MSAAWKKAVRDRSLEWGRSLLVVIAVALGIAAYATVMSTYAILERELNREYLATNPPSATLLVNPAGDDVLAIVRATAGVERAEPGRVAYGRIKAGAGHWRTLVLFVVADFSARRIATLSPAGGSWPPAVGEMLIERDAFQVAKAAIGDTVTVRLRSGDVRTLRVSGGVHDVGQAQARMENVVYAYTVAGTLPLVGLTATFDRVDLVVTGDRFNRDRIASIAATAKDALEAGGHTVSRIDIPAPGKHPHADLMAMLLLGISLFGLIVLALSGVLVFNLLTGIMAAQVRQIGIMKALGASRRQVAGIYLAQALCLGIAAVVVAVPTGRGGAELLVNYLAVLLNFDIASHAVPLWVYGLVSIIGVVVPVAAAVRPVWRGTAVPVVRALNSYGVAERFGARATDRLAARIRGLSVPEQLALRNLLRRRARTALTVTTLAASGLFFMSALNVRSSIKHTLNRANALSLYDLDVSLRSIEPMELVRRVVAASPTVREVEGGITSEAAVVREPQASPPAQSFDLHGAMGTAAAPRTDTLPRLFIVGMPRGARLQAFRMEQGRALEPADTDAIVLSSAYLRRNLGISAGQPLTLKFGPLEKTFQIVGISFEPFGSPVGYIPIAFFEQAGRHFDEANALRMTLASSDEAAVARAGEELDRGFEREGVREIGISTKSESNYAVDQHMLMVYAFLLIVSVLIGSVGVLGLMTTMSLNVLERRREIGAMRAIGATPWTIVRIVVGEGVALGVVSWILAAAVARPLAQALANWFGAAMFRSSLIFQFEPAALLIWLGAAVVLSALASAIPAWRASRTSVREAVGE